MAGYTVELRWERTDGGRRCIGVAVTSDGRILSDTESTVVLPDQEEQDFNSKHGPAGTLGLVAAQVVEGSARASVAAKVRELHPDLDRQARA